MLRHKEGEKMERQTQGQGRDRETGRQGDRKTDRDRNRDTERHRHRELGLYEQEKVYS